MPRETIWQNSSIYEHTPCESRYLNTLSLYCIYLGSFPFHPSFSVSPTCLIFAFYLGLWPLNLILTSLISIISHFTFLANSSLTDIIMHESRVIPACFSSGEKLTDDPAAVTKSGRCVFMSVYQTKIVGQCRLITVTWCKDVLLHGLSLSVQGPEGDSHYGCKIELKPWSFWKKQGSKHFIVEGKTVDVVWDLKFAKFNGETEPQSNFYVSIVCEEEVVLLLGDMKKEAYRKTGCRPALIEPILVSRKEHVFGKKRYSTRAKFHEKGSFHDISIECSSGSEVDPQMEIRIDGHQSVLVKHLQWKFRGNESIFVKKTRVEVYWDVHDWLFGSGPRHALFIFKPNTSPVSPSSPSTLASILLSTMPEDTATKEECNSIIGSSKFCLFLYAWKVE